MSDTELQHIRQAAPTLDRVGGFPTQAFASSAVNALLQRAIPTSRGGFGWGTDQIGGLELGRMLSECGAADLALGRLVEGHVNAARLIFTFGTAPLASLAAADIRSGRLIAIWNTERPHAPLRIVPDGNRLVLEGEKVFASGVGHVERAVVSATDQDGKQRLAYIRLDPAEARHVWWDLPAMRASSTGAITLSGITVDADDIFGSEGDYMREPDFSAGAWRTLAVQLGGVNHLIEIVREHLRHTTQDRADAQKLRFASLIALGQTIDLWIDRCAEALDGREISSDAAVALVNTARIVVMEAAETSITLAKQAIGARAFMPGNPAEKLIRDLDFYLRQPAPDQTRLDVAAYHLSRSERPSRNR